MEAGALRNKARKRVSPPPPGHPKRTSPFPFYAIHSDSGSEFPSSSIGKRAEENNIRFSKGGTGKKNGNRYAGRKNKSTVRDIVGYCRYSGERGRSALQAVYNAYDLLPSLFYPCMKLVSKERAGSEYRKRSDAAKPPYQRLIEREDVPLDRKPAVIDLKTSASLMEQKFLPDAILLLAASCLSDNGKQKVFPCLKLKSPEECPQCVIEFVTPPEIPAGFYKVFIARHHQAVN